MITHNLKLACSLVIMTLIFLYTIDRFNLITKLISYNIFLGIISLTLIFGIYLLVLVFIILKLSKIECEYEYFEPAIANIKYITQSFRGGYRKKDKYKK